MVQICFGIYDRDGTYSKYLGAAIYSILQNTDSEIAIHILHDCSLSTQNKEKFKRLTEKFHCKIYFYEVVLDAFWRQLPSVHTFSIGTLFRLKMADILPNFIDKIIYLDDDIIVHMDISELWELDIRNFAILGKKDIEDVPQVRNMCETGLLSYESYVNVGVMVLNLRLIRQEYKLYEEAIKFFALYPNCEFLDQDALNYIFRGRIGYLDARYNIFTKFLRVHTDSMLKRGIYHFAGDMPRHSGTFPPDRLFLECLLKTPWNQAADLFDFNGQHLKPCRQLVLQKDDIIAKQQQTIQQLQNFFQAVLCKLMQGKKKVFWGTRGKFHAQIMGMFSLSNEDYYVDNNPECWTHAWHGHEVKNPSSLLQENKNTIIIIVTTFHYEDVKKQLSNYGFLEYEHFFSGLCLLANDNVEKNMYLTKQMGQYL